MFPQNKSKCRVYNHLIQRAASVIPLGQPPMMFWADKSVFDLVWKILLESVFLVRWASTHFFPPDDWHWQCYSFVNKELIFDKWLNMIRYNLQSNILDININIKWYWADILIFSDGASRLVVNTDTKIQVITNNTLHENCCLCGIILVVTCVGGLLHSSMGTVCCVSGMPHHSHTHPHTHTHTHTNVYIMYTLYTLANWVEKYWLPGDNRGFTHNYSPFNFHYK